MKRKSLSMLLVLAVLLLAGACGNTNAPVTTESTSTTIKQTTEDTSQSENTTTPESSEAEVENSYYPVTITTYDASKNPVEITFNEEPKRVLAVYQSSIENLLALGLGDKIIATAQLDIEVKPEWKSDFEKSKYYEKSPGKEEVIGLEPDFIVSWSSYFGEKKLGDVHFWHERGVNTYIIQNSGIKRPNKVEYAYEDIMNLGKIFNKVDEATKIVEDMKNKINLGAEYTKDREKVKTLITEVNKENMFRVYGTDSIGGDVASQVGADLVFDKNSTVGAEDVINANPDVIFTIYYGDAIAKDEAIKRLTENESIQSVNAIKNSKVYAINLSEVYASGVRTADAIDSIIKGIYPDLEIE